MTKLYFLLYKATKIYGTKAEISCFGRSEIPIPTGQRAILPIPAVEAVAVPWQASEQQPGPASNPSAVCFRIPPENNTGFP